MRYETQQELRTELFSKVVGLWFCGVKIVRRVQSVQFGGIIEEKVGSVPREYHSLLFPNADAL